MEIDWTISFGDLLTAASVLVAVGVFIYTWRADGKRHRAEREAEQAKQEAEKKNESDLAQGQYYDFLKICIQYPELGMLLGSEEPPDESLSPADRRRRQAAYELLIGILETAYLYSLRITDPESRRRNWDGWESYTVAYIQRPAFRKAYDTIRPHLSAEFQDKIVKLSAKLP